MLSNLWSVIRYAARLLFRTPGVTFVAALILTVGIGANTTIFTIVDAVLLRALPYADPAAIFTLWQNNTLEGIQRDKVSPSNFLDWRERSRSFAAMVAVRPWRYEYIRNNEPDTLPASLVSEEFFDVLGVKPLYGRTLSPDDYRQGRNDVIVVGYELWRERFGGNPGVIGETLRFDDSQLTIVGVMPPGFYFLSKERQIWAPFLLDERYRRQRASPYLEVVARLKSGVTIDQAQTEMDVIGKLLASEYPKANLGIGIAVVPLSEYVVSHVRPVLWVLFGAVSFVLLIACANVGNLLLARASQRAREFAIRGALGATRTRLMRQFLVESLLVAVLGGIGGIILAYWTLHMSLALTPIDLPRIEEIHVSARVLISTLAVSVVVALGAGLAPSLSVSQPDVLQKLKDSGPTGTSGPTRHRMRDGLVVVEVALALVLLAGAGLLMRSFVTLVRVDPGFVPDRVVALEVNIWDRHPTPAQQSQFFRQSLDRLASVSGVEVAGAVTALPFQGESNIELESAFAIEGRPPVRSEDEPTTHVTIAAGEYFRAMRIPLLRGRPFNERDDSQAPPVVIVTASLARRFWPNEDPIGRRIVFRTERFAGAREIVGLVGDVRHTGLDDVPRSEVFVPHAQLPFGTMTFVVRASDDPVTVLPAVKKAIWEIDSAQVFERIVTLEQLIAGTLGARRFYLWLFGAFAAIALVLAAGGLYAVVSFVTTQRTHEIGLRVALGARPRDIFRLIVGQGMRPTLIGVGLGVMAALAVTRFLEGFLFGITPTDPMTFLLVSMVLTGIAGAATYIPASRALTVDPIVALRQQ
ncbi:MAG: ABC transporter permease [Vicinamibacterales bacterium]